MTNCKLLSININHFMHAIFRLLHYFSCLSRCFDIVELFLLFNNLKPRSRPFFVIGFIHADHAILAIKPMRHFNTIQQQIIKELGEVITGLVVYSEDGAGQHSQATCKCYGLVNKELDMDVA